MMRYISAHRKLFGVIGLVVAVVIVGLCSIFASAMLLNDKDTSRIDSFEACKNAGGSIAESYPEQCFIDGKSFVNELQRIDDASDYVGLTERAAFSRAEKEALPHRVVEHDGVSLPATKDFILGRLNFYIRDDVVYKVDVEGKG